MLFPTAEGKTGVKEGQRNVGTIKSGDGQRRARRARKSFRPYLKGRARNWGAGEGGTEGGRKGE